MSEHECIVCGDMHDPERAEQAERALALVQCCDDEPCSSCVACLQRTVEISDEKITTLRATLARVKVERDGWKHGLKEEVSELKAERDGLRAALDQLKNEQHAGWHDLSRPMSECQQYPCTLRLPVNNDPTGGV